MDALFKKSLWQQFGAAIDTLEDAINLCPDHLWTVTLWDDEEDAKYGQFWFVAYHTLFWLDLYLTSTYEDFAPPPPFVRGKLPENPYTREQICSYLDQCRTKCQSLIEGLSDEKARQMCTFEWVEATYYEMLLYNMRHVQEHAAQLNLVLGEHEISGQDWIPKVRSKPS
jgi:hypothetical protein